MQATIAWTFGRTKIKSKSFDADIPANKRGKSVHESEVARTSGREFLQSNPWITFALDFEKMRDWRFFESVGEARSKCRHLSRMPLPPLFAEEMERLYLAKGALATTAIEGNTLSEQQASEAVSGQLELPMSQEYLGIELENVIGAIRGIEASTKAETDVVRITPELLCDFNLQVLENTPSAGADGVVPGEFRHDSRVVGNYKAPSPADAEFLIRLLCDWLNGPDFEVIEDDGAGTFLRVLLRALIAHLYIAWIHPFADGNGRTARLAEFNILTSAGLPSVAAHLFSNHFNQTRSIYYMKMAESSQIKNGQFGFFSYAIEGFVDQLQTQLNFVHALVFSTSWRDFVYETFDRLGHSKTLRRQRELVLSLPPEGAEVPVAEVRMLTPSLAIAYDGKSQKTVSRDLNRLEELGLVIRSTTGVHANAEGTMRRFLPRRNTSHELF